MKWILSFIVITGTTGDPNQMEGFQFPSDRAFSSEAQCREFGEALKQELAFLEPLCEQKDAQAATEETAIVTQDI